MSTYISDKIIKSMDEMKTHLANLIQVIVTGTPAEVKAAQKDLPGVLKLRYIVTAVDVHSKYGFAYCYHKHDSASARDFIKKMQTVFPYKIKAIQTDNGSEFHKYFRDYLKKQNIIHYWNYPERPYRQGHIEKFNRTIQEESIDWNEVMLDDINRFNLKMTDWLIWYNTKRYHWVLNLETPVDYLLNNSYVPKMCWANTFV
jgi:transposase InsO family protein